MAYEAQNSDCREVDWFPTDEKKPARVAHEKIALTTHVLIGINGEIMAYEA